MGKILLCITLMISVAKTWDFTEHDLHNLTMEQKDIIDMAKMIGYRDGLGDALIYIAAVETRFGKFKNPSFKHCGVMQISVYHSGVTCHVLRDNLYLNMELASKTLRYWLKIYNGDLEKAFMSYNGGYGYNPHGKEYIARLEKVKLVFTNLKNDNILIQKE